MPETRSDGAVFYRHPDEYTNITLNGVSVLPFEPVEVMVKNGWGYVQVLKAMHTRIPDRPHDGPALTAGQGKTLVDGTRRNYVYWGEVVVTTP